MRHAAKRDANEPELLKIVKQFGAVWIQAPPLDGWCCFRERWTPVEIKNEEGRNRYTDSQVLFLASCRERNAPVWTWRTERDVFESLGARQTA
jgi:hypothetical protein